MRFKTIEYGIVTGYCLNNQPTFYVLKSITYFGFWEVGQLLGIDGKYGQPFLNLIDAEEYLKQILNDKTKHKNN